MSKLIITTMFLSIGLNVLAQNDNLFQQSFEGMFEIEPADTYIPEGVQGPLNPAVPLDGGLTALLVAGGAVGYRKYRARSKKN
jgi:hypothetical protein